MMSPPSIHDAHCEEQNILSVLDCSTPDFNLMIKRLEGIEEQISSLKADLIRQRDASLPLGSAKNPSDCFNRDHRRQTSLAKSSGKQFVEDATGATIFLGSHSDPPLALGCRRASDARILDDAFLERVAPRAYPLTNLWRPQVTLMEICQALPDDSDIIRYWEIYQTSVYPFYPALVTLEQFTASLFLFLEKRPLLKDDVVLKQELDLSWLSLLFAMLACGVQFSNDQIQERDLKSKVFICSSFECLRVTNFFSSTNLNQIQAMALIGHWLRNNLDTNTAWILMGSTIRLAQSIGLHDESLSMAPSAGLSALDHYERRRLWWMLTWQDTFLAFTYDRPFSTINVNCSIPYSPEISQPSMDNLVQNTLEYKRRLERVLEDAAPFLTNRSCCKTLQNHLERLALHIHVDYIICRLCRPCLESVGDLTMSTAVKESLSVECTWRAAEALECFLNMHRLFANVCRAWAFVHNAVSCAMTLKDLTSSSASVVRPQVEQYELLLQNLVAVLEKEEQQSQWCDADTNVRYFGPYSRCIKALKETFSPGFRNGAM
ncbi:hypothetical protein VTN02DRAFT_2150 [Thermoascus thermophilus]